MTDERADGRTDGGDCNIPIVFESVGIITVFYLSQYSQPFSVTNYNSSQINM